MRYLLSLVIVFLVFLVPSKVLAGEMSAEEVARIKAVKEQYMSQYKDCLNAAKAGQGSVQVCNKTFTDLVMSQVRSGANPSTSTTNSTKKVEKREEIKEKIDERKAEIVENMSERINKLNQKFVGHANENLARITALLAKVELRSETAESNGFDVTKVNEAISNATTKISNAQSAIDAQAVKVYEVDTSDGESKLGESASAELKEFHTDIEVVKSSMKEAKNAVIEALRTLKGLGNVDKE